MWSLIQVLSLYQRFLTSHFPVLLLLFVLTSAGVINNDSEFNAITFALNNTSASSNITIDLRTFNATEPGNYVCEQGKILIRSDQERTLKPLHNLFGIVRSIPFLSKKPSSKELLYRSEV